jgi:hypothetical protein
VLSNAVKFTNFGFADEFSQSTNSMPLMGIGENKTVLFGTQLSISRQYGGSGLGLAISKRLVD